MAKDKINSVDTEFTAGTDVQKITTALQTAVEGVPEQMQFTNLVNGEINPQRDTLIRTGKRSDGTKVYCAVIQTPTASELAETDEGRSYLDRVVSAGTMRKVSAVIANYLRSDMAEPIDLPATVSDFATTATSSGSGARRFDRAIWKKYARALVANLNQKIAGLALTVDKLESCLSNKALAETLYPSVPDALWTDNVLPFLIGKAPLVVEDEDGKETTHGAELFEHWAMTRDQLSGNDVDIDLGAIDLAEL